MKTGFNEVTAIDVILDVSLHPHNDIVIISALSRSIKTIYTLTMNIFLQ